MGRLVNPSCMLCRDSSSPTPPATDTIEHIITECRGTVEVRERIFPELLIALALVKPNHIYLTCPPSLHALDMTLAQFILDCTSFNLGDQYRLDINSTNLSTLFSVSRDLCYAAHNSRMTKLKSLKNNRE